MYLQSDKAFTLPDLFIFYKTHLVPVEPGGYFITICFYFIRVPFTLFLNIFHLPVLAE